MQHATVCKLHRGLPGNTANSSILRIRSDLLDSVWVTVAYKEALQERRLRIVRSANQYYTGGAVPNNAYATPDRRLHNEVCKSPSARIRGRS